jgi:RNA polymerase sigma-70 factor (ECF subfamily)
VDEPDPLGRFEGLVLPHLPACYNLARWLLRSEPDAEDCVQEAMVRALRAFSQFRGGDPRAWLFTIVRNSCYTHLRRRRPAGTLSPVEGSQELEVRDPAPDPEATLVQKSEQERVRRALGELPIEFREVLVLKEFEDLSYKEIAEVADIPLGTVMSRLSRARQRLQDRLQATREDP